MKKIHQTTCAHQSNLFTQTEPTEGYSKHLISEWRDITFISKLKGQQNTNMTRTQKREKKLCPKPRKKGQKLNSLISNPTRFNYAMVCFDINFSENHIKQTIANSIKWDIFCDFK